MPDLSLVPPAPDDPNAGNTLVTGVDLAEMLQLVFDELESDDLGRRLEAARRRREFRLVQGGKP